MVNHGSATGLPLTHDLTVAIETSIRFSHRSSGRPGADPWLKGGYFCKAAGRLIYIYIFFFF